MSDRDDFLAPVVRALQQRAAFICSNPDCRCLTIAPSTVNETDVIYAGEAAHITAAAFGGPRYNAALTPEERQSIANGIFLCAFCATMIDKNDGQDYPAPLLHRWKQDHEDWVRANLNRANKIIEITGTHEAAGIGEVTGLHISRSVKILPGTIVRAEGIGNITGTRID